MSAKADVVVLGGGIAGSFLARHLRLVRPDLSVVLLEARTHIDDFKVGESTVELAAHYMLKRLDLGSYLYRRQLPKNGLRFFFDDAERALPLTRMSEIGSDHMPFHPSFQLERARLERDLLEMAPGLGVDARLGARVEEVRIDGRAGHTVAFEQHGEKHELCCRWLCDASGRRHILHRALGVPVHKEQRLNTGGAWARYRGVSGFDAVGDTAWKARVRHTSRYLSTNHMMYPGYWIWLIPLAGDLMSVGVVYDKDCVANPPRTADAFEAFLREHRAVRDALDGAEREDFGTYAHIPYHAEAYFSADRWVVTGEAGAFTDPFYSPGSDFIATANELAVSLILTDLGEGEAALATRARLYEAFYRARYESTLALYVGLYPWMGSYELFRLRFLFDFHNYYNLIAWPYMAGRLGDDAWLAAEVDRAPRVLQALGAMRDNFRAFGEHLRATGSYHAHNEGRFANGLNGVGQLQSLLGPTLDEGVRAAELDRAFGHVTAALLERVVGDTGLSERRVALSELGLKEVVALGPLGERSHRRLLTRCARRLGEGLPEGLKVVLEPGAPSVPHVEGPLADDARAGVQARWDERAPSLARES